MYDRKVYIYNSKNGKLQSNLKRLNDRDLMHPTLNSQVAGMSDTQSVTPSISVDPTKLESNLLASLHQNTENLLIFGNFTKPEISLISKCNLKNIANLNHAEIIEKVSAAVYYEVARKPPCFSNELEILNHDLEHNVNLTKDREKRHNPHNPSNQSIFEPTGSKFEIADMPYHLPVDSNAKNSISWLRISPNNEFIASQRNDMKRIIYIWGNLVEDSNFINKPHSVIECSDDILCASFSPCKDESKLAICTGNDKIYLWTENSILSIENPNDVRFSIVSLRWSSDGKYLILMSKTQMMICFV